MPDARGGRIDAASLTDRFERNGQLEARLRKLRHGLAPNSALHIVRVRFTEPRKPRPKDGQGQPF
jgi:hypothetical protein